MQTLTPSQYRSFWHEVFFARLRDLTALLAPEFAAIVDWTKGVSDLSPALEEFLPPEVAARKCADHLVRLTTRDGLKFVVLYMVDSSEEPGPVPPVRLHYYKSELARRFSDDIAILGIREQEAERFMLRVPLN